MVMASLDFFSKSLEEVLDFLMMTSATKLTLNSFYPRQISIRIAARQM